MKKSVIVLSAIAFPIASSAAIFTVTTASKAFAQPGAAARFPLPAGTTLQKQVKYPSANGNFYLIFAEDGNLIIKARNDKYIWGLDQVTKNRTRTSHVEIKPDGSFGVYEEKGSELWSAKGKRDPSAKLNLTDDGVLQMLTPSEILWASDGVVGPILKEAAKFPITAGTTLKKGMKYPSPAGNFYLVFQNDGNLIISHKDDAYVWGLDKFVKPLSRSFRVEVKPDGSFGLYNATGSPVWSADGKHVPGSSLNLTDEGVLQMASPSGEILWASNDSLAPSIKVFVNRADVKPCTAEPGWAKCVELPNPKMQIMGTAAVSPSAMNAVANIYTEMTKRLRPTSDNPNPRSKFDGFKVYITNGEPWAALSNVSPVGPMWKPQTGPKSGNFLRGGASNNFLWISEQMIAKKGVKTRNADRTPDNEFRTFDQVVHEFAHSIDFQLVPDQVVNKFDGNGTPVESFALRTQQWFGAPGGKIPPAQEAELSKIFTSRVSFSIEGYKP